MYNLDNVIRMYYSAVPVQRIIDGAVDYEAFPEQEFVQLSKAYFRQYSDTENHQLYRYIQDSVDEDGHPFSGMRDRSGLNVFAALEELAQQLLTMENNEVLCIYHRLIRFREVTKFVEEDLLVCAYLAVRFKQYSDFGWNVTIGHNNVQLNRIMERGISENHFHLFGSAPSFHLLWIHFMNYVADDFLASVAEKIDREQRMVRKHYSTQYAEDSFMIRILKAAVIRVHIMRYLIGKEFKDIIALPECDYDVEKLLSGSENVLQFQREIQRAINYIKNSAILFDLKDLTDYALYYVKKAGCAETEKYWCAGERWLMYRMLVNELSGKVNDEQSKKIFRWFYAYLVIKQNVRSELVQVNETVGFENFAVYSGRKKDYPDLEKMIETALYESVATGNIQSLEMRISPCKKDDENAAMVKWIDSVIENQHILGQNTDYYYVFHFSKEQDRPLGRREDFDGLRCRHYEKRQELKVQAQAIHDFRENYREQASEVLGIDACSQEIGCRPEVFASIFRFLSEHVVKKVVGAEKIEVGQLKMTFHVGEDFLDVVDGLRAVDEAVRFLNLQCGDRIGHGTVLGINVKKWYLFKQNTIILSKQDFLDNIVWLYHKLVEYKIENMDNLRDYLLGWFEFYFSDIYLCMEDGSTRKFGHYNIYTYYEAWKLRGDEPDLYLQGYYDREGVNTEKWLVNKKYQEGFDSRKHKEVAYLYYLYHYDWDVRVRGSKIVQVYVPSIYLEGVSQIQKVMRKKFAALGIGVETNPSSNLAISPISSYEEHSVIAMYNMDMVLDTDQIRECPQMNVSINTDDKGVFHTSLENEYALVACAMENVKDEKGAPLYNRQMIYQWIDNIREMGNSQSFRERVRDDG